MPPQNTQPGFDPNVSLPKEKRHLSGILTTVILVVLLLAALGFGIWAFMERQDYKNNVDSKISEAVAVAEEKNSEAKEAEFAEREKNPLKTYQGPATFGSVGIKYPKTWSAFITESDSGGTLIDGYFHPNFVPGLRSGTAFALHLQVVNGAYSDELKKYDNDAKEGTVTVTTISVPGVPDVAGVRIDGEIENDKQGSLVMFPVRDKTLKITTESDQFKTDLNDIILPSLTFAP